jgi:hypothetical protein
MKATQVEQTGPKGITPNRNKRIVKFSDSRGLPIALVSGFDDCVLDEVLLDDETQRAYARGDYPDEHVTLDEFDMELTIFNVTGLSGAQLPKDHGQREAIRSILAAMFRYPEMPDALGEHCGQGK